MFSSHETHREAMSAFHPSTLGQTMEKNEAGHPPLGPAVADQLLARLSGDDAFRTLFGTDPAAALRELGVSESDAKAAVSGESCLHAKQLASKEEIAGTREALLGYLTAQGSHTVVHAFEAGQIATALRLA
ncbi:NHLP-related RiPP peptide [[Pseudomonas] boreopolis]|jgi:putative modified peptide|uniref:Uncharacterized protein n=1 Tax=Xanthomonas boreopolis TaxID=86183 RepID=A0A919F7Z3_9XANT|nr:hypothetical protein GCM10009090_20500 [[Pseudomonas] boreopolis]